MDGAQHREEGRGFLGAMGVLQLGSFRKEHPSNMHDSELALVQENLHLLNNSEFEVHSHLETYLF